jgi:4-amino-4-deoxy-L-arabinose transferase-like glycosyltransferase
MLSGGPSDASLLTRLDRVLMAAFLLSVFVPGTIGVSLFDRDEGWYAQVVREMVAGGDWLIPRYLGESRYFKPPWLYWCSAVSVSLLGWSEFALRLPCVLASVATWMIVADWAARQHSRLRLCSSAEHADAAATPAQSEAPPSPPPLPQGGEGVGRAAAWWTAVIGATSIGPTIAGKLLLADSHFVLFIVIAMRAWIRGAGVPACTSVAGSRARGRVESGQMGPRSAESVGPADPTYGTYVFWAAIGLALLSKGPATLAVLAPIALARLLWDTPRDLSWPQRILRLWPGRGWYLAVLIGLPWYAYVAWADWPTFAQGFIGANMLGRVSRGIEGHSGPPGYYIVTSLAAVLPWTPVVIAAIVAAWRSRRTDGDARRLLIWLAAPWPLFELIVTKLPHYVLPLFPPAAMLAGCWLAQRRVSTAHPTSWCKIPIWHPTLRKSSPASPVGERAAIPQDAIAIRSPRRPRVLIGATATWVLLLWLGGLWLLPGLEPHRLSRVVAEAVNTRAAPGEGVLANGFKEPTMFFYLRPAARNLRDDDRWREFVGDKAFWLIARRSRIAGLRSVLEIDDASREVFTGWNYAAWRRETVWVVRARSRG